MKQPKIDLQDDDFTCILIAAIRYTLGRQTYMPSLVTGFIRPLLPHLTDKALYLFERDIREAGDFAERVFGERDKAYGDPHIDKPVWDKFYADVIAEQNRRTAHEESRQIHLET